MGQHCPFPLLITEILNIVHCFRLFGGEICLCFQMEWAQGERNMAEALERAILMQGLR